MTYLPTLVPGDNTVLTAARRVLAARGAPSNGPSLLRAASACTRPAAVGQFASRGDPMKRILVCIDGSPRGPSVLHAAATLARTTGAKLLLCRSIGVPAELPPNV